MQTFQNRRDFLTSLSAAAALSFCGGVSTVKADQLPETNTVRLPHWEDGSAYCWAALFVAGQLLRNEGFEVTYVQGDPSTDNSEWLARDQVDFDQNMPSMQIKLLDAGVPLKILTGLHTGCFELIGKTDIRSLTDLKGKRVGTWVMGSHPQVLTALMISYVGIDPNKDIEWIVTSDTSPADLFINGKIDAFLAGPPEPQKLRAQNIGHTIVNNGVDRPWSQYFCCMLAGSTEYVTKYPVATKHILRAVLKGADVCASQPSSVARQLVDLGHFADYDDALITLNDIGYNTWRDYDAQDSVRFYALRMQETGMIKSSPQKVIAEGTDWHFLDELKRELKK